MGGALPKVLIVSAADSRFMPLLRGMMDSAALSRAESAMAFACFDIGLSPADRGWLDTFCYRVMSPPGQFGFDPAQHSPALASFLARPFLPQIFPGFEVYVWIDSDVWLQDPAVLARYVEGAQHKGLAIAHERERGYRVQPWLFGWTAKHFLKGYGIVAGSALLAKRHLNAGFFAGHADAPHWAAWARYYEAAILKSGNLVPHDQFSLVQMVHGGSKAGPERLTTAVLGPENNWICDRGVPMWHDTLGVFCKPYAPFEPIGAMHLAGPAKSKPYTIKRTNGGSFTTYLTRGASAAFPVTAAPLEARPVRDTEARRSPTAGPAAAALLS